MTIVLFLLVLVALIVVHEFGHFIAAKWSGMRVDEFGIGFPPRAWGFRKGETEYTLNWLPLGGFVRIYGEDEQDRVVGVDSPRSFGSRPRILQAIVLIAGILMNLVFAWVLLSITLGLGTVRALEPSDYTHAKDISLAVALVLPGSPAAVAGLEPGDTITHAQFGPNEFNASDPSNFSDFIAKDTDQQPISITLERAYAPVTITATPKTGVLPSEPSRVALGISVAPVGTLAVPWWQAPWEGLKLTWAIVLETAVGLWHFFVGLATFSANLSQVAGPIGIAIAVGNASHQGLVPLLTFIALISVNLALVNLLPFPALDGGRLLFVIIEAVTRRPLPAAATRALNTVGFGLLILLLLVVSAHDVIAHFG